MYALPQAVLSDTPAFRACIAILAWGTLLLITAYDITAVPAKDALPAI